ASNRLPLEQGGARATTPTGAEAWREGAKEAAEFLTGLIGDRMVDWFLIEAQLAYVAYVRDVNVEQAMVINGWARGKGGPATIAREKKRGLWSDHLRDPGRRCDGIAGSRRGRPPTASCDLVVPWIRHPRIVMSWVLRTGRRRSRRRRSRQSRRS